VSNIQGNDGQPAMVQMTQEEFDRLQTVQRNEMARQAGFDMDNPVASLVLDKHWNSEVTVEGLQKFRDQYSVGIAGESSDEGDEEEIPDGPTGKVTEVTGSDGKQAGDAQSQLSGGSNVPGQITTPDPKLATSKAYQDLIETGATREDALAGALDAAIRVTGQAHVLDRIRKRQDDEARAQAIVSGAEAATGAAN
jgi:hypothetical protein